MSSGSGNLGENTGGTGPTLKPYLRRKKSSLGETKIAVLGAEGVGKSGEICFCYHQNFLNHLKTKADTFANSVDPDETAHNEPSHLDLHSLLVSS